MQSLTEAALMLSFASRPLKSLFQDLILTGTVILKNRVEKVILKDFSL
jgi:hypothetical protein